MNVGNHEVRDETTTTPSRAADDHDDDDDDDDDHEHDHEYDDDTRSALIRSRVGGCGGNGEFDEMMMRTAYRRHSRSRSLALKSRLVAAISLRS